MDDKRISCGEIVPLEMFSSKAPSVKFSRAKDVSVSETVSVLSCHANLAQ